MEILKVVFEIEKLNEICMIHFSNKVVLQSQEFIRDDNVFIFSWINFFPDEVSTRELIDQSNELLALAYLMKYKGMNEISLERNQYLLHFTKEEILDMSRNTDFKF